MKNKINKFLITFTLFFILFFTVIAHFINKNYHNKVKSKPKKYCYETFYGPVNAVIYIKDLKYKDEYLKYYRKVENREDSYIVFPVKTLSTDSPVYVLGFSDDNLLAEVVSYHDKGTIYGGSYTRCWVYAKTLHNTSPKPR